jgi:F0F1-type ATP synthase delta subunit
MIEMSKFYTMHRFLKTKVETNLFLEDLSEAENSVYKHTTKDEELIKDFTAKYHSLLADINLNLKEKESILKNFLEIKSYFASLDYMRIGLAFTPSDRFLTQLQTTLTKLIGFPPLFDVAVDPAISGGIIIDYNGKHVDISFKRLLDLYFTEHRDVIVSGI